MCLFKDRYVYLLIRAFQWGSSVAVLICLCACCFIFCVPLGIIFLFFTCLSFVWSLEEVGGGGGGGAVLRESGISSVSSLGFGYCFLIMYNGHLLTKNAKEIFMVFHLLLGYGYPVFF